MSGAVDFQRVFEGSPEPQLLLERGGVVVAVTDGYLRTAGQGRDRALGRPLFELPPYAGQDEAATLRLRDELETVWRSGLQFPHQLVGGFISAALSVPVMDASGVVHQIVHTLGQAARSSERFESNSERRLRKLIEHSYDALLLLDQSGKPFYASPSSERVRGYPAEELLRASLLELIHPDDLPRFGAAVKKLLAEPGGVMAIQYRARHRDGHWQTLETIAVNHLHDPDILAIVVSSRDVTERVVLEETKRRILESQKLESLGILAGGIAHDFNNILTTILGNASLTQLELPEASPALGHVAQIEEAARRATDLCRQMLAYAGKGRFILQRTNVNQLIEDTTHLLQVSISKKAVLRFDLDREVPSVVVDNTQIRQVLMNLVINASDAIGDRSGVISIRTGVMRAERDELDRTFQAPHIPPGDYIFIEVSDTGSGMSPEVQARIFEPFFTSKFTGRGLGLAAVSGIVQGHKGALTVSSEPGKGSTFKLLLPVTAGEADEVVLPKSPPAPLVAHGTILVVDDEATIQAIARRLLESLGFRVLLASDGRQALTVYAEHRAEITGVLMDLTMPHLDGEETFRELCRLDPAVRVLLMSGYNEQEAVARFVGQGLAGFIQKPFSVDELKAGLRSILG